MNLKDYISKRSFALYIIFFISSFFLFLLYWTNDITSYGNFHLSVNDSLTGIVGDVFMRGGNLFVGFPTLGVSHVFSRGMVKYFFSAFRVPALFVISNFFILLFSFSALLFVSLIRFFRYRYNANKEEKTEETPQKQSYSLSTIISNVWKWFLVTVFALSVFPIDEFTSWIPSFDYIRKTRINNSMGCFVYELISLNLGGETYNRRLLCAWVFSSAEFVLKVLVIASCCLLIYSKARMPNWLKKIPGSLKLGNNKTSIYIPVIVFSFFLLSFSATHFVYGGLPVSWSQLAAVFQARNFASLSFHAPIPPVQKLFSVPYLVFAGGWFNPFFPVGYSLCLAPFAKLGYPWFLNLIVGCVTLYFFFKLLLRLTITRSAAIWGTALLALSPSFLRMSSQFQSQGLLNLCFVIFLGEYLRWRDTNGRGWIKLVTAALFLGVGVNILPLSALAFTLPFVFAIVFEAVKNRRFLDLLLFLVTIALSLAIFTWLTHKQTGSVVLPLADSFIWLGGKASAISRGMGEKGFINLLRNLNYINTSFLGWPIPAFLLVVLSQFLPSDDVNFFRLLLAGLLTLLAAHAVFFNPRVGYHAQVLNSCASVIVLLVIVGILNLHKILFPSDVPRSITCAFFLIISITVLCVDFIPKVVGDVGEPNRLLSHMEKESNIKNVVVFINQDMIDYKQAFYMNDPSLNESIIFAKEADTVSMRELMEHFPNRKPYAFSFSDDGDPVFLPQKFY